MRWSTKKIEGCCSVKGCSQKLKAKGLCDAHYQMNRKYGRTHRVLRLYDGDKCAEVECRAAARACGYCRKHYRIARRSGVLHPQKYKRDHPLYEMWWARRKAEALAPEWQDDFLRFVVDVGQKPGQFFNLVTLRDGPFGPDNFRWREQIKRKSGESRKVFNARKWQAQNVGRPGWQKERDLKRKYGITTDQYNEKQKAQDNRCAICRKPETKIDHRLGVLKKLTVDHCHKTSKVRELLCARCNFVIGMVEESAPILNAMIVYLEKHQEVNEL